MRALILSATMATCLGATNAPADVLVTFIEGAPKDRFVIETTGDCTLGPAQVEINLATSPAGLIFDTTASGAGVEVFQPFELVSGGDVVKQNPSVKDGDQAVTLALKSLPVGTRVAFTVDVDDTGGARELTVSNAEIAGASVTLTTDKGSTTAPFTNTSKARVSAPDCAS